jgi:RNA polymerase sigma-70 factor (ECF subfamily)
MSHGTDEELMERMQAGDVAAFEVLYDRHCSRGLRVARGLTRDAELAAEAVQDAFLSIWRNGHRYTETKGSFRSWAMTVVHNRTIDLVRRQAARADGVPLDDALLGTLSDARRGPAETATLLADVHLVRDRLDELPPSQREAIVLAYYGGLSQGEIATRLSVPLGTIKGRMRLALEKLRESLGAELAAVS